MNIILATDHAGFEMKEQLKNLLIEQGHTVDDVGAFNYDYDDDYPVYMHQAGRKLSQAPIGRAIVFGGSGTGEAITCNRYPGVRAVVYNGQTSEVIRIARQHNDANVLSVGARFVTMEQLPEVVQIFLETEFEAGRHTERVVAIDKTLDTL